MCQWKFLVFDVKREHVCQKHSEGGRNILGGIGAEAARRVEGRPTALSRVFYTHFDPFFRVDAVLLRRGMALNTQFCEIEFARLRGLDDLTFNDATSSVLTSMIIYVEPHWLALEVPRSASDLRPASPWRGERVPGSERWYCRW